MPLQEKTIIIRNFVFGVEDSLVSTVGFLTGIAAASVPRSTIFLTGFVLIFVEAISMGAGSFLAEDSAEDFEKKAEVPIKYPLHGGVVMFFSYFLSGFIPLLPYVFLSVKTAIPVSVGASLAALFALGLFSAKISHTPLIKSATRMMIVAGLAILAGVLVGKIFNTQI